MVHGIDGDGQAIENEVCQIIQGEGTLQITGKGTGYGFGGEDLTVQSGTITSDVGFCKITNEFTMTGGAVTASGADYGLYIVEGPVNVSGGKLDLQGTSCGIFVSGIPNYGAVSVNISGGTVKAVGKSTAGIFVQPNEDNYDPDTSPQAIHITGGSLTAGGGVASLYARMLMLPAVLWPETGDRRAFTQQKVSASAAPKHMSNGTAPAFWMFMGKPKPPLPAA